MYKGSIAKNALVATLLGAALAIGCGSTAGSDESAPARTSQSVRATPVPHLAAGRHHQVMLKADGTVWTLGRNQYGQLGTGVNNAGTVSPATSSSAVQVQGLPTNASVVAVAAGYYHSLVLLSDGNVYGWGYNYYGSLGNGTSGGSGIQITPVKVLLSTDANGNLISKAVAISAGENYSLALLENGTIYAWGYGFDGALGNGTSTTTQSTPVKVLLPTDANGNPISNAVAIASGANHNLAVRADGTVYAWGNNSSGKLGLDPTTTTKVTTPVQVSGISSATDVAAGTAHSMALLANGTVYAWGANGNGQLGNGQTNSNGDPTPSYTYTPGLVVVSTNPVTGLSNVTRIGAGFIHSVAVSSTGTAYAWGDNSMGELGSTSQLFSVIPLSVPGLAGPVTSIAARDNDTVVEIDDGTTRSFWGWGLNNYEQVGPWTLLTGGGHADHENTPRQLL